MPIQNRSQVPIGTVLEGKYRITREVGRGGMATVYEAENVDIGKRVAVKVLAAELVTSRIVRERFIREARAAASIRSPYICDVYDSGMYEERPFLVMELLEGESLYDMMTRVRRIDTRVTIRVMTLTARGLGRAHEAGVVHRDMKPENIFLIKNEEGQTTVKIVDFGLAKFYEPTGGDESQARLTREGALFGTPAYMSPEQAKGQGEVDHRCDLWALGCIAYECLTGRTVWKVDQGVAMILAQIAGSPLPKPSTLRKDLPESFDRWFRKALNRDINKRFQNAREFADTLAESLQPLLEASQDGAPTSSRGFDAPEDVAPATVPPDDRFPDSPASTGRPLTDDSAAESAPSTALPYSEPRPDSPARGRSGHAITTLLASAMVMLTGYALWLYVLHPARPRHVAAADSSATSPAPSASSRPRSRPVERESYALQIGAAQEWLSKGRLDNAVKMFKEAFKNGGTGVARMLLAHAAVAQEEAKTNHCKVTGLGRPRAFETTSQSSRPTLAITKTGTILVWVDNHHDATKRQGVSTRLDSALRRVAPTLVITPETADARSVQLSPAGENLVLVYSVRGRTDPGGYVRLLGENGQIAGKARRIAEVDQHRITPMLAPTPSGSYWVVWEEPFSRGTRDLVARHLNAELEPIADPVRLTAYAPAQRGTNGVSSPSVAVAHQHLYVPYVVSSGKKSQLFIQRIALSDPLLQEGLPKTEAELKKSRPGGKGGDKDLFVGSVQPLGAERGKNAEPQITCVDIGCYVVWDDERGGALAAFIDQEKGEALWHREIAARGARPNVAASGARTVVVWYESGRLKLADLTRDGMGKVSVLARVTGYQPHPDVTPGLKAGEWLIAWRDYEAGHLEAYVLRAECP